MALDRTFPPSHQVRTLRFQLEGPNESLLLQARARVDALCERDLPDVLSSILDGLAGADEVLEIPRLDVELGDLPAGELDLSAIAGAILRAVVNLPPAGFVSSSVIPTDRHRMGAEPIDDPPSLTRHALPDYRLAQLIGYLLDGDLGPQDCRIGLVKIFDDLPPPETILEAVLRSVGRAQRTLRRAAIMRLLAIADPPFLSTLARQVRTRLSEWPVTHSTPAITEDAVNAILKQGGAASLAARAETVLAAFWPDPPTRPETGGTAEDTQTAKGEFDEKARAIVQAQNAGVVLLHVFLPQLFDKLDLLDGTGFADEAAHVTAVRLVHYLATAETTAEEPFLAIPKLLCGLGAEVPVLTQAPLEPAHLELADELLEAVIAHWSKLGNASPEGLRETFLMRPGIIKGLPGRPRLIVERSGVDILLGSLPWAISPVRLPWLNRPIQVDWG